MSSKKVTDTITVLWTKEYKELERNALRWITMQAERKKAVHTNPVFNIRCNEIIRKRDWPSTSEIDKLIKARKGKK